MKKSNLRKIIRESIKELINEQNSLTPHYYRGYGSPSGAPNCQYSGIQVWRKNYNANTFYQAIGSPSPGSWIGFEHGYPGWGTNGYACLKYYGTTVPPGNNYTGMLVNSEGFNIDYNTINITTSTGNNDCGPCFAATSTPPTPGCDPSAWSNHANWTSTFTNTVANHNNPCNFLNNKIAQFTNQIPNVGPVWANQLQCKLDLCNQLHAQNNC